MAAHAPIDFVREYPDGSLEKVQITRPEAIADMAKFAQKKLKITFRVAYGLHPDDDGRDIAYLGATIKRREKDEAGKWADVVYVVCEEFPDNNPLAIHDAVDRLVKRAFLYKRG